MKIVETRLNRATLNSKDFIFLSDINQYTIDIQVKKATINKGFILVIP